MGSVLSDGSSLDIDVAANTPASTVFTVLWNVLDTAILPCWTSLAHASPSLFIRDVTRHQLRTGSVMRLDTACASVIAEDDAAASGLQQVALTTVEQLCNTHQVSAGERTAASGYAQAMATGMQSVFMYDLPAYGSTYNLYNPKSHGHDSASIVVLDRDVYGRLFKETVLRSPAVWPAYSGLARVFA